MQLYARDITGNTCNVHQAKKGNDYFCLECKARVRVRSGELLRAHFFHIHDHGSCRQAGKTEEHIAIQRLIQQQIGQSLCVEEMRFAQIGRVADVAWVEKKLIFEVQCSPIAAVEIEERNRDYASCGWDVVWILYDKTFSYKRPNAAMRYLCNTTHYYSDVVTIYDQVHFSRALKRIITLDTIKPLSIPEKLPRLPFELYKRFCSWSYIVECDYLWGALYLGEDVVKSSFPLKAVALGAILRCLTAFRAVWHVVLERSCR